MRKKILSTMGNPYRADCAWNSSSGRYHKRLNFSTTNSLPLVNVKEDGTANKVDENAFSVRSLPFLREEKFVQMNRRSSPIGIGCNNVVYGSSKIRENGWGKETCIKVNSNEVGPQVSLSKSLACLPEEAVRDRRKHLTRIELSSEEVGLRLSLAKILACLPEESVGDGRNHCTRMELKRAIELRIKKRVKEQHLHGKFYKLMERVITDPSTLKDSYDILRLNSNNRLESTGDEICFSTMADQLRKGDFDVKANAFSFFVKGSKSEGLLLPNLKLRVIQEAIRVTLEVVYRPSFSKISHGCRSGRGPWSALRYVSQEMSKSDWWFTMHMQKKADVVVLSNLIQFMQEKIEDNKLFSFIRLMFNAKILRLDFGGYPKGQGLPQEGALSPILMNIYLNNLDSQLFTIFMRYECLGHDSEATGDKHSTLRHWIRRQMKGNNREESTNVSYLRLYACRYMDEMVVSVSGSKEIATEVRKEIHDYLKQSLYIDTVEQHDILPVNDTCSHGIQFIGTVIRGSHETEPIRTVHKLKDKVRMFAAQKQEAWDRGMVRIAKKCLAHGLRRIKESEITHLGPGDPLLNQISYYRKGGMKTDHWFNVLIKVWLQDVNPTGCINLKALLANHIAEPGIPQELRESFYKFQKCAKDYVSSETASTIQLQSDTDNKRMAPTMVTRIDAPIYHIQKKLMSYGLINKEGFPRYVSDLVLHDDMLIIHWFSGLVNRWLKWYSKYHNFKDIKFMMLEYIKKSCTRTLAAKHKVDESLIEKRFELELNGIPLTEDLETDLATLTPGTCSDDDDESLMYGMLHSGLCKLSLFQIEELLQCPICSVIGCLNRTSCIYTLHTRDQQKFPGWKTGFATGIHPSLNMEKLALCSQHVKDLYLGHITLQSVEFGSLGR